MRSIVVSGKAVTLEQTFRFPEHKPNPYLAAEITSKLSQVNAR